MKHFVVWFFVLQFATGHNLMAELCQMPNLLQHFESHKQHTPDLSLAQFLWLHYGSNHDESDRRHADLPLQCMHVMFAESTVPQSLFLEVPSFPPTTIAKVKIFISDEFLRISAPLSGVFRPPLA